MIKDIQALSLLDILPDNILRDAQVYAAAKALDSELQNVTAATVECLHLPRLDVLPEKVIDLLAWQWHVDFYEPLGMDIATKRKLIRESIAWHRMKGTPAAVEKIVSAAFDTSTVKEWYEYGGEPYFFKVITEDVTTDRTELARMKHAIETVKNTRSWLEKIEFLLHLKDDADMEDDFLTHVTARGTLFDEYPWPARRLDGTWSLCGSRYLDGAEHLDGTWSLDGLKGKLSRLSESVETLAITCLQFIDGAFRDDFGRTALKLDGGWLLNGQNHLGTDALPFDAGGYVTVRERRTLDGSWTLDGGERDYLDGSMLLDGRFHLTGGRRRLRLAKWTDFLDGAKTNTKPVKIVPDGWLHPRLEDDATATDRLSVWKNLRGENAEDSMKRAVEIGEGQTLDGGWTLGETVTPIDAAGLEILQYKRLSGGWALDGGDRLRLRGAFALNGANTLEKRGNRLAIRRTTARI